PIAPPAVIAVGGVIASGKSTWAGRAASLACSPLVQSDRVRKHLLGAAPTEALHDAPFTGSYAPEFTDRVYDAVFDRARAVLDSGRPVVLDATFSKRSQRQAARELARSHGVSFLFV